MLDHSCEFDVEDFSSGSTLAVVLAVQRPRLEERVVVASLGAICSVWLLYTLWFSASPTNRIGPPCLFYTLTGHPCPFCGGTRAYAAMWHFDLGSAAHFYPLAPLLFPATVAVAGYAAWSLLSARGLHLKAPTWLYWTGASGGLLALAMSWTLKLVWLGN
jgi:hypothetical protein